MTRQRASPAPRSFPDTHINLGEMPKPRLFDCERATAAPHRVRPITAQGFYRPPIQKAAEMQPACHSNVDQLGRCQAACNVARGELWLIGI